MNKNRPLVIIVILTLAIGACFALPKAKYTSVKIVSKLNIPERMYDWKSQDFSEKLNKDDLRYNFISDIFARLYINYYRENLLLLILDAGNFHNPKICFGASGYKIRELENLKINLDDKDFNAHALYMQKGDEGMLLVYWISIDKKIVDWTEQKWRELWYSLFNKKRTGLMIRLDIPTSPNNVENSLKLARSFIKDLSLKVSPRDAEYLFGK